MMNQELEKLISISRLRLQRKSPFFATLSLFTNFKFTDNISTAATDGKDIYLNLDFFLPLSASQREGLILHELLHAALLHRLRSGTREQELWNLAADMVVNLIIKNEKHFDLPEGAVLPPDDWQKLGLKQKPEWEKLSVEEIYELLLKAPQDVQDSLKLSEKYLDLIPDGITSKQENNSPQSANLENQSNSISLHTQAELRRHWQSAMQQAIVVARTNQQGKLPAGIERQIAEITESQLDWRSYLWRYLVQTPTDFQGYDRRFVGRGLYLESLVGESVQVYVAIDTSGSIGSQEMKMFLGEVLGILSSYPHLKCSLYYADAAIYGPYDINKHAEIPVPQGGSGTSFIPFFEAVEKERDFNGEGEAVCVYLTDGYGCFPANQPSLPTLWVVTPGGLDLKKFPFGEAVRLLSS